MRCLMMYVLHNILLGLPDNSVRGIHEQRVPKFGLKPEAKRALGRPGWED
jgi:hypothetical protein